MNNLIILLTQAVGDFETVLLIWPKEEELRDHIGRTYVAVAGSLVGLGYTDVTSAQTRAPNPPRRNGSRLPKIFLC